MELDRIYNMDCLYGMKRMESGTVNLALFDPPYNVGVVTQRNCKKMVNAWDKIENYIPWMMEVLREVHRVMKPNGVLYLWHNDVTQIAELIHEIHAANIFSLQSFCILDKGKSYRARSWQNLRADNKTALRSWFNRCEYCLHFFKVDGEGAKCGSGLERINSNPACYKPLKEWYRAEMERLGLTPADVRKKYMEATGKGDGMLRHYFKDTQFELPTREVWEKVFAPLGFCYKGAYDGMRQDFDAMRGDYESLRHTHHCDYMHSNVWRRKVIPSNNRFHTCEKPVDILERMIRVSSNPGDVVLDPFIGGGSTAVACMNTGRRFVGFERDVQYFCTAKARIEAASMQGRLDLYGEFAAAAN